MVAGLCSSCLILALGCGPQCLLNLIEGRFYGAEIACQIEAAVHVCAILNEFFSVAGIALHSYSLVVRRHDLSPKTALKCTVVVWLFCCLMTGVFSHFSPAYLMINGVYCFYSFQAFAPLVVPGLFISMTIMAVCYFKIWNEYRSTVQVCARMKISHKAKPDKTNPQFDGVRRDLSHLRVARRSSLFVILLLLGWGFSALSSLYELCAGQENEVLVTAAGVAGASFGWWVPFAYVRVSKWHKAFMKKLFGWVCIPCFGRAWWRASLNPKKVPYSPMRDDASQRNAARRSQRVAPGRNSTSVQLAATATNADEAICKNEEVASVSPPTEIQEEAREVKTQDFVELQDP